MKGHNSAAVRNWIIVAAASFAIAAGTLVSFPAQQAQRGGGAAPPAGARGTGAVRKALPFVGRTAKCGDSQTRRSIPTRGGEFTMRSVRSRLWSRREKQ